MEDQALEFGFVTGGPATTCDCGAVVLQGQAPCHSVEFDVEAFTE